MLNINTPAQAKKSARALEKALERNGISLQHGKALDVLAALCGRQDWNALSQSLSPEGVNAMLSEHELQHAADAAGDAFGTEAMLVAHTGFQLRYSAETELCDYVRVCDPLGREIVYWTSSEWAEDPQLVMGAMLGALVRSQPLEVLKGASATPAPATVAAKARRMPTIQDVCFTDVSAVCIDGGSGYRMNYVEDQVVGLLDEVGSEEFQEQKDENAIFMERDDDGQIFEEELTLEQLASLKWDPKKKMFVAPDGTTYEFYFPVPMQNWFDMFSAQLPTSPEPEATVADVKAVQPDVSQAPSLRLFTATFGSDAAPVMQMRTRIVGYTETDAKARLLDQYKALPATLANVSLQPSEDWEVKRYCVFVDGGYYNGVPTLAEALNLAEVLEPSATDEVTIEDEDGNCLWTIKALGDADADTSAQEPGSNA
jgi:hypothetical protein